ncbi:glycosyltransferase family 2 protein [Alteromonas ponticola]|uniref:Glycosyltransferase family 2 protein n=1 Tax=Alteromonas aquimaris TaxID=2998417 RepID=A0ABT3PB28_9ALTE|nr:glycosyltransferase family 2 protein [Alteromonas aquimaris]MCW8109953.1 glycosyltransferase family 2 protein [Alteromonas aquimaris]
MISVIFSTYNSPDWMEKTLWGLHYQTFQDFEIIIADDGSTHETQQRIAEFEQASQRNIKHVWQPDDGFQKTRILNKALMEAEGDYVVFTDGDCIMRNDFLAVHDHYREPGYFLSGGYFKLPMSTSKAITRDDIANGRPFDVNWLVANGLKKTHKTMKLTANGWKAKLLNTLTPTNASWNGHNASGWIKDIFAVNGFDERMQYGGEDRELGERLLNRGLKSKQIRYSAICVHLDHARGYATQEMRDKNQAIRNSTKSEKKIWTPYGIEKTEIAQASGS